MKIKYGITYDLNKYSAEELCEIANTLNHWEWPDILGAKPEWWDDAPLFLRGSFQKMRGAFTKNRYDATKEILRDIRIRVGQGKLLEYHWVHRLGKTKEEYREWALYLLMDQRKY